MDEAGEVFCLCGAQYRKAGIPSHPNYRIRPETPENAVYLEEAADQLERQSGIFYQRTPVESGDIDAFDAVTSLGYFLHFHFAFCANEKQFDGRVELFQGSCDGDSGENMSAGVSSRDDDTI